jgi:16S rRNA (adenine1518-N6/adenine1519-N6)-dimethyltransferase
VTFGPREASELLRRHGLAPKRSLGQNFVVDPNTVRRVARLAAVGPGDHVIEIGAGLGALTLALVETGARVTAVEVDAGLATVLRETLPSAVEILHADARRLDWPAVLGGEPAVLVANLPYNIATPLVADLLDDVPLVTRMLVMVQLEVAQRLCARPRTPAYGAVTVKVAYWATAALVGKVPASVFMPRPKVESALIEIVRRERPSVAEDVPRELLFGLVRTAFQQRRKTLRRSLAGRVAAETFAAAGIDNGARPEELDVVAWGRLAAAVARAAPGAGAPGDGAGPMSA